MMDDDGHVLDAEYDVKAEPGGRILSLVLESSSGTSANRAARNVQYRPALRLLLARLADRRAVLEEGLVDSRVTRALEEKERRLFDAPIQLDASTDAEELRLQLCSAQSSIGQAAGAVKGGNSTKRIRLRLTVPGYGLADSARLAADLSRPTESRSELSDVLPGQLRLGAQQGPAFEVEARAARPRSGAGYQADPLVRRAVEQYAVHCAAACYPDHTVMDVGAIASYDLRAFKGNEELHIEVKGSIGTVDNVELTVAEVAHARTIRTDLVVVDQINYERKADGSIHTYGGRLRRWTDWQPADQALQPTRYRYTLPE
ncbi:protein NO VEIN domain-containing protein [Nonomuraea sp. NPDC049714]|uniref:protein NO VEIN domain-containing protein n=1 Tax=Nonomuraea sp. NPDC049714 TaxID=3364357 RepID=UPI0037AFC53F